MLVQMAISRTREYAADNLGARICGNPMWLASALSPIENAAHQVPNMEAERNPATAHMFIINPLTGHGMDNLFATHPVDREPHRGAAAARGGDGRAGRGDWVGAPHRRGARGAGRSAGRGAKEYPGARGA